MYTELSIREMEDIDGGVNGLKVAGGVLTVVGGAMECAAPGGQLPGAVAVIGGIKMIGTGLSE